MAGVSGVRVEEQERERDAEVGVGSETSMNPPFTLLFFLLFFGSFATLAKF